MVGNEKKFKTYIEDTINDLQKALNILNDKGK